MGVQRAYDALIDAIEKKKPDNEIKRLADCFSKARNLARQARDKWKAKRRIPGDVRSRAAIEKANSSRS